MNTRKKWLAGCGGVLFALLVVLTFMLWQAWASLQGPEGSYFDSGGVKIHYTDEGQGTPVVLVHGFANPAHLQWRRTGRIDALKKYYRVIALDNRGHGRSGKPHDPAQYGVQMAEDIVRLLDHLKIDKAHVVGYSMGGFITIKLACLHPDRLLSAAACGAGWLQPDEENREFGEAVAHAIETKTGFGPLLKRLGIPDRPMTFLEKMAMHFVLTFVHDPMALAAVSRGGIQLAPTEAELRANTVPMLTIIGDKDGLLEEARSLADTMANHQLIVLEGRDHMNTDVSPKFTEELLDFLARHTPDHISQGAVGIDPAGVEK